MVCEKDIAEFHFILTIYLLPIFQRNYMNHHMAKFLAFRPPSVRHRISTLPI